MASILRLPTSNCLIVSLMTVAVVADLRGGVLMPRSSQGASFIQIRRNGGSDANRNTQSVHWVFTTDCSAYMFNQGNLMLASAYHVNQPGNFTWITFGCDRPEQKAAFTQLAHPRANVWHQPVLKLTDPKTGKPYQDFQASNRPISIAAWWNDVHPTEEAIGILDPDMMWLRPVSLVESPQSATAGPWETNAAAPKRGTGARYGQGCVPHRFSDATMLDICSGKESCVRIKNDNNRCSELYASGPPWIMHRNDASDVLGVWTDTAVKVHQNYPEMLAEQVSYGVAQMEFDVENHLDPFWFLSVSHNSQPWGAVALVESYDPCMERAPPPPELNLPPLWHACSTYEIPHLQGQGFRLHKDHIHKDLLDCEAPLLHYPPRDALKQYSRNIGVRSSGGPSTGFMETWSVCAYTNLVNFHARAFKTKYCENPNLEAVFSYPSHAQGFINQSSWLQRTFRKGGWSDVDYMVEGREKV